MICGGPNGQAQECAFDPERSRDDGWRGCRLRDFERRRRPVPRHCKIHRNKWAERFRDEGVNGLPDRSSRPLSLRSQMAPASTAAIEALRQQRYTAKQFAIEVGVSAAKLAAAGVLSLCSVVSALAGSFTQPGSTIGPPQGAPLPPGVFFSDWITQGCRTSPSRLCLGDNISVLIWSTPWPIAGTRLQLIVRQSFRFGTASTT